MASGRRLRTSSRARFSSSRLTQIPTSRANGSLPEGLMRSWSLTRGGGPADEAGEGEPVQAL